MIRALQAQGNPQIREHAKKALDVQEAALKAVTDETFHGAIDGRTRELGILPRVCWLVVKGTAVRVKVNALLCLSKTFHFFTVRAVVDKVSWSVAFLSLTASRATASMQVQWHDWLWLVPATKQWTCCPKQLNGRARFIFSNARSFLWEKSSDSFRDE